MPVLRNTVSAQVYEQLLEALVSQQVKPGERLKLGTFATQFGVSHTPVREALTRLETEGIVRSEPHHGAYVPSLTPKDISELFEARLMCETFAVEKALPSLLPATTQRLRILNSAYDAAGGDVSAAGRVLIASLENEFHAAIIALARNARISTIYRQLGVHIHTTLLIGSRLAPRDILSMPEHEAVIAALESGDLAAAKARVTEHIINTRDYLLEHLAVPDAA